MNKKAKVKLKLVNFKATPGEVVVMRANARRHTKGDLSKYIRLVALGRWAPRTLRRVKMKKAA